MLFKDWVNKRNAWWKNTKSININGIEYVPLSLAEQLFQERQQLVRKWKAARNKLRLRHSACQDHKPDEQDGF